MQNGEAPQGTVAARITLADELQIISADIDRASNRLDRLLATAEGKELRAARQVASEAGAALGQDNAKGTAALAEAIAAAPGPLATDCIQIGSSKIYGNITATGLAVGSKIRPKLPTGIRVEAVKLADNEWELSVNGEPKDRPDDAKVQRDILAFDCEIDATLPKAAAPIEDRPFEVWVSTENAIAVRGSHGTIVLPEKGDTQRSPQCIELDARYWRRVWPATDKSADSPAYAVMRDALHDALAKLQNAPQVGHPDFVMNHMSMFHLNPIIDRIASTLSTVTLCEQALAENKASRTTSRNESSL